ncbi:hypothetical protein KC19_VG289300 [Ceratodon purpureus]|uniref:RRM domain-containing protein n=1 Tax=Ceratodon purpureus TaxID=3225 RepID=A0A8T0HVE9_CERPU|nr:hypothetical protein KC19_VG289300 [Ceratodon purpureus]
MADPGEDEDYDLKDEELVDFEGSDYGFESAEEVETVASEAPLPIIAIAEALALESAEIEDVRDGRADEVALQTPLVDVVDHTIKHRLPFKPDLEDGELDDAAMPEGSDPEAVANGGDNDGGENDRRERKRRNDRQVGERSIRCGNNYARRNIVEMALVHSRHLRGRGSEKMHGSQPNNYPRGTKGANAAPCQRVNSGPGIMGPGRPPISVEHRGNMTLRSINRGFPRLIGGVVFSGRLNQTENNMHSHIRDSRPVQEHILRHQRILQFAQEQVQHAQVQAAQAQAQVQVGVLAQAQAHAQVQHIHVQAQVHLANPGALRPALNSSTLHPIMGLDRTGGQVKASHTMMHLHVQSPDLNAQINFPRHFQDFGTRAPLGADLYAIRGSLWAPPLNQRRNEGRSVAPRQLNAWPPSSAVRHEILNMPAARGRARIQGQGQVISPFWVESPGGEILAGFSSPLEVISQTFPNNGTPGIAPEGVMALGTPKTRGSLPMIMPNHDAANRENISSKMVDIRPQVDSTWRTNGENHYKFGTLAPSSRNDNSSTVWANSSPGGQAGFKRSRENGMDRRHCSKPAPLTCVGNGTGIAGNNLIQLGGPVITSRVLSVSGFPENTSMAAVVEAFEKQGKILDFRKDENENAFLITFSSMAEAISAKRYLHRTILNGRQITVDYVAAFIV